MKTTTKHYNLFKEECRKWAKKLLIEEVRYDFEWTELECRANCTFDLINQLATIRLNTEMNTDSEKELVEVIKSSAKHEMLETLVGEIRALAYASCKTEDELMSANHRLVRKLEKIIK